MLSDSTLEISRCNKIHISWIALLLLALVELSVIIWVAYDHSTPCWDTAMHRLNSLEVYNQFIHPQFKNIHWYRYIFAVSQLYPPLVYIFNACLKFICGEAANTELVANLVFIAIMFFSVYYAATTIFKNNLVGPIAGALIMFYPAIFWTAHSALLDCAANAMAALGLAYFIWWSDKPNTAKSIIFGLMLGLITLTKNNTPLIFIGPFLAYIVFALQKENNEKTDYGKIGQLFIVSLFAFLVVLPWIILAGPAVIKFIGSIQEQQFGLQDRIAEIWLNFKLFSTVDLPAIVSPVLFSCFLVAVMTNWKPITKNKIYLLSSIACGIITASLFRWPHQFRYITPLAGPVAVFTAQLFAQAWLSKKILWRFVCVAIAILACLQFIYDGFTPYPIHARGWLRKLMSIVGEDFKIDSQHTNAQGISIHPLKNLDWGVNWVLSIIERNSEPNKIPALMVMPNTDTVNCSPYIYTAKMEKFDMHFGSPREHSELGDKVGFKKNIAIWYDWYLLKSGEQGLSFNNPQASATYEQWIKFVRDSKLYKLIGTKPLPDGSALELYKRVN